MKYDYNLEFYIWLYLIYIFRVVIGVIYIGLWQGKKKHSNFTGTFKWTFLLTFNLQGDHPMIGGIKTSSALPLWRFTISRGLINSLRKNISAVLIILLTFQ